MVALLAPAPRGVPRAPRDKGWPALVGRPGGWGSALHVPAPSVPWVRWQSQRRAAFKGKRGWMGLLACGRCLAPGMTPPARPASVLWATPLGPAAPEAIQALPRDVTVAMLRGTPRLWEVLGGSSAVYTLGPRLTRRPHLSAHFCP